jgi:predicted SAM-dependent methyltransferase
MIEHISLEQGKFMISECYRVLKPGGRVRISTPDLKFLIQLYLHPEKKIHQNYVKFSQRYFPKHTIVTDTIVVNNFFKDWGHQFIYDKKSLASIFESAGFDKVIFPLVYESNDTRLCNLEKHGMEITEEFNSLESIVVEAEK